MPSAPRSRAFVDWSGVSAFARTFRRATLVGDHHQAFERLPEGLVAGLGVTLASAFEQRLLQGQLADEDMAGEAVDRDRVAFADRGAVGVELAVGHAELDRVGAADRRDALAARDDGRVRVRAARARQDALGRDHAVVVVGRRLPSHEDHALPRLAPRLGLVGREDDRAGRGAGRGVEPGRDRGRARRVDPALEQLLEAVRVDPQQGLALVDQAFPEHVVRP